MRRNFVVKIGLLLLMCLSVSSLAQQKPLTNADVVNMVKGGLAESVVISAIQLNPATYDISPTALLALKKAGVTQQEQDAMLATMKAAAAPNPVRQLRQHRNPRKANPPLELRPGIRRAGACRRFPSCRARLRRPCRSTKRNSHKQKPSLRPCPAWLPILS